jgi:D-arginine dehydrogenase
MLAPSFDVVVIGAGIAGAAAAAELSTTHRVLVLERESQLGYHSTGRSAAIFSETYGNAVIRALSRASRAFLTAPPSGFSESELTRPRGFLHIARPDQLASLDAFIRTHDVAAATRRLKPLEARALCPILREDYLAAAALESDGADLDVHRLHQGFLRSLKHNGGRLVTDAEVLAIRRSGTVWRVLTAAGEVSAPVLANAAGAWADRIAALAGVTPIGLVPCRRTAILVAPPPGLATGSWPAVIDADEAFYFKPDAGLLLLSPADETPCEPCDAQPDELDVAQAIERVQLACTLEIRSVRRKWAGLRSFVADRAPAIGFDAAAPGFLWLAGHGGYGIQMAPAAARLAASLVRSDALPAELAELGFSADLVSPGRPLGSRRTGELDGSHGKEDCDG